jgi:hypothetical protein
MLKKKLFLNITQMISRKLQNRRRISRRRPIAKAAKRVSKKKEKKVYQAKFIEVLDEKIMKQVPLGKMNMNVNAQDKKYITRLNKYKPSKRTGINVGDILYIEGGEREWCCYLALPGKVQWLGDDGDTYDFILNLANYSAILEAHNVKYANLFNNNTYYEINQNGLEQKSGPNSNIDEYLLGSVVERDTPARIMRDLADSHML